MKQQKIFAVLLSIGFTAASFFSAPRNFLTTTQAQKQSSPAPHIADCDNSPLAELDKLIQLRFHERADNFGILRVLPMSYHRNENTLFSAVNFAPRNEEETLMVKSLRDEGWKIGLFLAGRSVLSQKPAKEIWENPKRDYYARKPINNPILLTPQTNVEELPPAFDLWDEAQKAMKALRKNQSQYDFTMGKWEFTARPIRASEPSCLQCHVSDATPNRFGNLQLAALDQSHNAQTNLKEKRSVSLLKIGDPLGIALYAYQRKQ